MGFGINGSGVNRYNTEGFSPLSGGIQPMGDMILPGHGAGVDPFGFLDSPVALSPLQANQATLHPGWASPIGENTMTFGWPALGANGAKPSVLAMQQPPRPYPPAAPAGGMSQLSGMMDFFKGMISGLMYFKLSEKMLNGV